MTGGEFFDQQNLQIPGQAPAL